MQGRSIGEKEKEKENEEEGIGVKKSRAKQNIKEQRVARRRTI
jgi:hypothetical protein